jgi:hypothetical protein
MNSPSENPWDHLTRAARQTQPVKAPIVPTPRVQEIRRRVVALVRAILWRRVSLILALVAGLAWLAISLLLPGENPHPTLIPLPSDAIQDSLKP